MSSSQILLMSRKTKLHTVLFMIGYCGLQISQAVPYTSPDSFSLNDLSTLTSDIGAANVSN